MEEAATPLPNEETTPPVTNIYFGAIRQARAAFAFKGSSKPLPLEDRTGLFLPLRRTAGHAAGFRVSEVISQTLSTMTTYNQLWT